MVNVRKFLGLAIVALIALVTSAHAQFIGYTSPQTVNQNLGSNITCTGSTQTFAISNLGQTQHYLAIKSASSPVAQTFHAEIDGLDTVGNVFQISDVMDAAGSAILNSISGTGYFPVIQVNITCSPNTATYAANYSGSSATAAPLVGSYLIAQVDKISFTNLPANANQSDTFKTPFASSAGEINFQGNVPASSTLTIFCDSTGVSQEATAAVFALASGTANTQHFVVPDNPCSTARVLYTSGGASANNIATEYIFSVPGRAMPAQQFTHIVGTTATVIKATPGYLHTLSINLGAAGTVSVFDLASASCTGTPATNQVAIITAVATTLQTFTYDVNTLNGICVKASVAMDLTVSAQ